MRFSRLLLTLVLTSLVCPNLGVADTSKRQEVDLSVKLRFESDQPAKGKAFLRIRKRGHSGIEIGSVQSGKPVAPSRDVDFYSLGEIDSAEKTFQTRIKLGEEGATADVIVKRGGPECQPSQNNQFPSSGCFPSAGDSVCMGSDISLMGKEALSLDLVCSGPLGGAK
jgi:hypothetical protein